MNILFLFFLTSIALLERIVFDLGPNVELVTAVMIVSSLFFGFRVSTFVTLLVVILSDLLIGNSAIFIFTWSGFLIPILLMNKLKLSNNVTKQLLGGMSLGLGANLFFYFWTNFGVWLLDATGMYTNDFAGLVLAYARALPFLKLQLLSSIVFVPLAITGMQALQRLQVIQPANLLAKAWLNKEK